MPRTVDCRSSLGYEFEWTGSGAQTFTHNFAIPTRHGRIGAKLEILLGDAYLSAITTNGFTVTATSTTGQGRFTPDVIPNDYE